MIHCGQFIMSNFSLSHTVLQRRLPQTLSDWSLQHPENWNSNAVEEWIKFVAEKYQFPDDIRRKCLTRLRGVTGKRLISMHLADFQHLLKETGELVYIAFLQIMDVGPDFEDRTKVYREKIQSILDVLVQSNKVIQFPLWKTIPVERWTSKEVNQWVISLVDENSCLQPHSERLLETLEFVDGHQLLNMTVGDFTTAAGEYGSMIVESLETLRKTEAKSE